MAVSARRVVPFYCQASCKISKNFHNKYSNSKYNLVLALWSSNQIEKRHSRVQWLTCKIKCTRVIKWGKRKLVLEPYSHWQLYLVHSVCMTSVVVAPRRRTSISTTSALVKNNLVTRSRSRASKFSRPTTKSRKWLKVLASLPISFRRTLCKWTLNINKAQWAGQTQKKWARRQTSRQWIGTYRQHWIFKWFNVKM